MVEELNARRRWRQSMRQKMLPEMRLTHPSDIQRMQQWEQQMEEEMELLRRSGRASCDEADRWKSRASNWKRTASAKQKHIDSLRKDLNDFLSCGIKNNERDAWRKKVTSLENDLELLRSNCRVYEKELAHWKGACKAQESKIEDLKKELDNSRARVEILQETLVKCKKDMR